MTILYALLVLLVAVLVITITSLYDLIIWLFIRNVEMLQVVGVLLVIQVNTGMKV